MTFADAILKLRSERRLSQTQLAKELGVSYTSVNRWENGRSLPTKMMLLVIRRYLFSYTHLTLPTILLV